MMPVRVAVEPSSMAVMESSARLGDVFSTVSVVVSVSTRPVSEFSTETLIV